MIILFIFDKTTIHNITSRAAIMAFMTDRANGCRSSSGTENEPSVVRIPPPIIIKPHIRNTKV